MQRGSEVAYQCIHALRAAEQGIAAAKYQGSTVVYCFDHRLHDERIVRKYLKRCQGSENRLWAEIQTLHRGMGALGSVIEPSENINNANVNARIVQIQQMSLVGQSQLSKRMHEYKDLRLNPTETMIRISLCTWKLCLASHHKLLFRNSFSSRRNILIHTHTHTHTKYYPEKNLINPSTTCQEFKSIDQLKMGKYSNNHHH